MKVPARDVQMLGNSVIGGEVVQYDVPLSRGEVEVVVPTAGAATTTATLIPTFGIVVTCHQQQHHLVHALAHQNTPRRQVQLVKAYNTAELGWNKSVSVPSSMVVMVVVAVVMMVVVVLMVVVVVLIGERVRLLWQWYEI